MSNLKKFVLAPLLCAAMMIASVVAISNAVKVAQAAENPSVTVSVNEVAYVHDPRGNRLWMGDIVSQTYVYQDDILPNKATDSLLPQDIIDVYALYDIENSSATLAQMAEVVRQDMIANNVTSDDLIMKRTMTDVPVNCASGVETGIYVQSRLGKYIEKFEVSTDGGNTWADPRGEDNAKYPNIYSMAYAYRFTPISGQVWKFRVTISEIPENVMPTVTIYDTEYDASTEALTVYAKLTDSLVDEYNLVHYGISVDGVNYIADNFNNAPGSGMSEEGYFAVTVKVQNGREFDLKGWAQYTYTSTPHKDNYTEQTIVADLDSIIANVKENAVKTTYLSAGYVPLPEVTPDVPGTDVPTNPDTPDAPGGDTPDVPGGNDAPQGGCGGAVAMLSAFMGLIALAVVGKKY
ncbi:MAG: hypothetical protein IKD20_01575 [Clostridia bacterium]|nr:hypothetical protein [Clostridia bacterium]